MHSLFESLDLAGQCCLAWLNPQQDYLPTGGYEPAHDTGRWWDAMLRREASTDLAIPSETEARLLGNLQRLTANPDGLLMKVEGWHGMRAVVNPHNFREAFIAFSALARWRNSAWAAEAGHRLLETLDRLWQPDGRLDYTCLHCWGTVPLSEDPFVDQRRPGEWFDSTTSTGRALEGLIWFYEVTGDALALSLAERIARHHLTMSVSPEGLPRREILEPNNVGHNHSFLGTLRGLALFGLLTGQCEYLDVVSRTYRRSLFVNHITETGYTPHDLGRVRFSNDQGVPIGETASCGDVLQLALWLGLRAGQPELLDDVERLMRARILPSQVTARFPEQAANSRWLGAWGVYGDPYGLGSILDVLAAVCHTVCDVYDHVVTRDARGLRVNLHFSIQRPEAWVVSTRTDRAQLAVTPLVRDNLLIRVPGWAPRESLRLTVNGVPQSLEWLGGYLYLRPEVAPVGSTVVLTYDLPERTTTENPGGKREYRFWWKGDEVVASAPPTVIYDGGPV